MSTQGSEITLRAHGSEEVRLRSLARELAMDILPRGVILANHGIDEEEFGRIAASPSFGRMYQDAVATWHSALNTKERVELKTLSAVEEALPEMFAMLHARNEPLSSRVALFSAMQKGAGIGGNVQGDNTAPKVSISINMGTNTVEVKEVSPVIEGSAISIEDQ